MSPTDISVPSFSVRIVESVSCTETGDLVWNWKETGDAEKDYWSAWIHSLPKYEAGDNFGRIPLSVQLWIRSSSDLLFDFAILMSGLRMRLMAVRIWFQLIFHVVRVQDYEGLGLPLTAPTTELGKLRGTAAALVWHVKELNCGLEWEDKAVLCSEKTRKFHSFANWFVCTWRTSQVCRGMAWTLRAFYRCHHLRHVSSCFMSLDGHSTHSNLWKQRECKRMLCCSSCTFDGQLLAKLVSSVPQVPAWTQDLQDLCSGMCQWLCYKAACDNLNGRGQKNVVKPH